MYLAQLSKGPGEGLVGTGSLRGGNSLDTECLIVDRRRGRYYTEVDRRRHVRQSRA